MKIKRTSQSWRPESSLKNAASLYPAEAVDNLVLQHVVLQPQPAKRKGASCPFNTNTQSLYPRIAQYRAPQGDAKHPTMHLCPGASTRWGLPKLGSKHMILHTSSWIQMYQLPIYSCQIIRKRSYAMSYTNAFAKCRSLSTIRQIKCNLNAHKESQCRT
jgi:hypothetical protein